MIDSTYFSEHLPEQIRAMSGPATVRVYLQNGQVLEVYKTDRIEVGYVLLQVYPQDGSAAVGSDDPTKIELANGPRFAIPFGSISHVEVTQEIETVVGFQNVQ